MEVCRGMKIAIVDDERKWRNEATIVLNQIIEQSDEVEEYDSGESFLAGEKAYDVVIIDIEMPGMDGFETTIEYKNEYPKATVIILTTHLELARKGYLVEAFRYIDKTQMQEELKEAFDKIRQLYSRENYHIVGKKNSMTKSIPIKDVIFIETKSKGVIIHVNDETYFSDVKINELENWLRNYDFFRCNKSFLVNLSAVQKMNNKFVYFEGNQKAYISVRKLAETKKQYIETKKRFASM